MLYCHVATSHGFNGSSLCINSSHLYTKVLHLLVTFSTGLFKTIDNGIIGMDTFRTFP